MLILGRVSEVIDEESFSIAWYHRAPLGLKKDTTVYLVLLPKPTGEFSHNMAEVILTTINPESWGDLWRIECRFHERHGVVAGLLNVLREQSINILYQESATVQQDMVHSLSIIADLRNYTEGSEHTWARISNTSLNSLNTLAKRIAVSSLEDILMEEDQPAVTVNRMHNYYQAYRPYRLSSLAFNPTVLSVGAGGKIHINQPLFIDAIKRQLWGNNYITRTQSKLEKVILNTHTEERYISVLFPDPANNIVVYEIIHEERVGALAIITNIIKELKLNILNSYNRLQLMGTEAHWNVILDIGSREPTRVTDEIKKRIQAIDPMLVKRFEIKSPHTLNKRSFV